MKILSNERSKIGPSLPTLDEDTELQRRSGPDVIRSVDPYPARERSEAIYGETDIDPRREEQPSAHRADEDEHL